MPQNTSLFPGPKCLGLTKKVRNFKNLQKTSVAKIENNQQHCFFASCLFLIRFFKNQGVICTLNGKAPKLLFSDTIGHDQIERAQKRVLRILFPEVSYSKALEGTGLKTIFIDARNYVALCLNKLQRELAGLLPARNDNKRYNFRNRRMFSISRVKTKRLRNSFIMHYADKRQL